MRFTWFLKYYFFHKPNLGIYFIEYDDIIIKQRIILEGKVAYIFISRGLKLVQRYIKMLRCICCPWPVFAPTKFHP